MTPSSGDDRSRGLPVPGPGVSRAEPYRVPGHPAPLTWRLAGNEGARPPGDLRKVEEAERLRSYPAAGELEARLAERHGVGPESVLVTAGADDALFRAMQAVGAPGRRVVLPVPTFAMIARYVALARAEIEEVDWPGGPYPLEEALARVEPETAAVLVVSPNNPTGATATARQVEGLLEGAPRALVVVDQAYGEYGGEDLGPAALSRANGVYLRTLSKAWGLAGLRVGYAVGDPEVIRWMRSCGNPYPVSGPSIEIALRALAGSAPWVETHVARVQEERTRLTALLEELGQEPQPSEANFVLCRFADASWAADALAGLGIGVRRFPGEPHLAGRLRITCPGDEDGFGALEGALRAALDPQALLLDMDGVLADVSGSYRETIRRTAASWKVEVSGEEIEAAKAAGGANDDWRLTHRLLSERGVDVDLEDVIERFEAIYQGTEEEPGLRSTERLLPDREDLEALAARLPLAVVTGRPRLDTERFLEERGLGDLVAATVCMEDAPSKPDPAPVRKALETLGAERAWMVGDNPDDIRAARAAGVVPLGTLAPGAGEETADALFRAGAARILEGLGELRDLLGEEKSR